MSSSIKERKGGGWLGSYYQGFMGSAADMDLILSAGRASEHQGLRERAACFVTGSLSAAVQRMDYGKALEQRAPRHCRDRSRAKH